jgi:hypothetical protein
MLITSQGTSFLIAPNKKDKFKKKLRLVGICVYWFSKYSILKNVFPFYKCLRVFQPKKVCPSSRNGTSTRTKV